MQRTPLFFEVLHSAQTAQLQICRTIMAGLFKMGVTPLPFAGSLDEAHSMFANLNAEGRPPALFVVNTFWTEEHLPEIDALIGPTPALFFVREIVTETTMLHAKQSSVDANSQLEKMAPRMHSIWTYGARLVDPLAHRAASAIYEFLQTGNFACIERRTTFQEAMSMTDSVKTASLRRSGLYRRFEDTPGPPSSSVIVAGGAAVAIAPSPPSSMAPPKPLVVSPEQFLKMTGVSQPDARDTPPPAPKPSTIATQPAAPEDVGFRGRLKEMSLACILTTLELERKTGMLTVRRADESAIIAIRCGQVVRASLEANLPTAMDVTGAKVVYYALLWPDGEFTFQTTPIDGPNEVNAPIQSLLLENARRVDTERQGNA